MDGQGTDQGGQPQQPGMPNQTPPAGGDTGGGVPPTNPEPTAPTEEGNGGMGGGTPGGGMPPTNPGGAPQGGAV